MSLAERPDVHESRPVDPGLHLFDSGVGTHAFVPDGSRVYDVSAEVFAALGVALRSGGQALDDALERFSTNGSPFIDDVAPEPPSLRSLSLNVAQVCNLGCTYCYASGGDFGQPAAIMPWHVAEAAVHTLVGQADAGERVHIAFLGGEPLIGRDLIRRTVTLAVRLGGEHGIRTSFSITTNATLMTEADVEFFAAHRFAVTVSIDGVGETNDALRPFKTGRGSYDRIITRIAPLLAAQRSAGASGADHVTVSARVTVTPRNLDLLATLEGLLAAGFEHVGFSPMLSSPTGQDQLAADDLAIVLEQMVRCGRAFESEILQGRPYGFANAADALTNIHRGVHRPYPCGAGAGYLSVSADGGLFACHRFVGDEARAMGDVTAGPDRRKRIAFLTDRHVHRQEPCSSCWARYLCGGGCHHEAINRGRPACDYIRGWLHHCLGMYVRIMEQRPEYFASAALPPAR